MIHYIQGDLLQSEAIALVNTVNTVGVMGKGIALQFKESFPSNNKRYIAACKSGELIPGRLVSTWDENLQSGRKLIINFPTKVHWKQASQYDYIEKGLMALRQLIIEEKIESIAIPPLGCGNGGLDWCKVKPMIVSLLQDLNMRVFIYEPNAEIKAVLQKQETKKEVQLTPARASLLYALFAYESMGEFSSLFVANKLAYFLQRKGQALKLDFKAHHYGPYAIGVEKVLYHLNGVYLKGLEQGQAKPFEPLYLNYEKWEEVKDYVETKLATEDVSRVRELLTFISGFTSELSLEILASVDFIIDENPTFGIDDVMESISSWNTRKRNLFKREYVATTYNYLKAYQNKIF